jgi:cell division septation protein DedD
MSPRTSGDSDTPDDDLNQPSVLSSRIRPASTGPHRHAALTGESLRPDVRRYLYRGKHRRPQPVLRAIQATTALLMFTGAGAALAHAQTTPQETRPQSAVQLALGRPSPHELRAEALPGTKTTTSTAPTTTPAPTSTEKPTEKPAEKTTEKTTETSTTKPTWLPVSQSAAQPTDQLGTWLNKALGILKANGYSESKMNASQIRAIIEHESAGNPNAINLWDSNASKGTPSKGLMQTIDPTFAAWSLPGHRSIYNPVDNIIAGVRYAIATYGSISNVPGVVSMSSGGGYQGY